jgi:hypothetical protein
MDTESIEGKVIPPEITSLWTRNPLNWRKSYSDGNYQIMDTESIEGKVIPLEITSLWTRNPLKEKLFRRELLAQDQNVGENPPKANNFRIINFD